MVSINSHVVACNFTRAALTAPVALVLADNAFKAGRVESAVRYLDIAYAILDANIGTTRTGANASPTGG